MLYFCDQGGPGGGPLRLGGGTLQKIFKLNGICLPLSKAKKTVVPEPNLPKKTWTTSGIFF